jgi:hypothetical protein
LPESPHGAAGPRQTRTRLVPDRSNSSRIGVAAARQKEIYTGRR